MRRRNSFELTEDPNPFTGDYEYQVPIFVLTLLPPEKGPREAGKLQFGFVTNGIESAIRQAKVEAGDKDVNVIGTANTAQQCLKAVWLMNYMLTSCRSSWVMVCGHLKVLVKDRFDLKECRSWNCPVEE